MQINSNRKIGAVILAAGRGKRMKLKKINKTTLPLNGKPLILYPVELFEKMKIKPVIIVVGHAKESVKKVLEKSDVVFAEQTRRLGTGHALKCAMKFLDKSTSDLFVINGDDAYIYTKDLLDDMLNKHIRSNASITLLTIKIDDPTGIGRIIRNHLGQVVEIVEEKDASDLQKKIKEININCFIFRRDFLNKYLNKISKSSAVGEYYLTSLVRIAHLNAEKVEVVDGGRLSWRGVNTKEELEKAHDILVTLNN